MKIVVFPDRIYKDPRANAPCPLDHSNAANWANVIVYSKDANMPPSHRTSPLSIKCVFHGQELYEIEGNRYAVDDKSYLIVNHQQPYAFGVNSRQPLESLSIFFEPDFIQEILEGLVKPADKLLAEGQASSRQPVEIYRRLHRAKDFIDSCYQQQIQLPQIARIAQLSRYHFLRLFKTAFNETPYQYLTRRRLETARTLLATTDIPITQVCYEAGFEDLSSFGRLFRQFSGLSPKAFRRDTARLN
ncbi:MAG: helix-turn-helix domain-containing protein [bacterium]